MQYLNKLLACIERRPEVAQAIEDAVVNADALLVGQIVTAAMRDQVQFEIDAIDDHLTVLYTMRSHIPGRLWGNDNSEG